MGAIRLQLTTDSITNIFNTQNVIPTALSLSSIEVCFDIVDIVGSEHAVMSMVDGNGNIQIKSQSFISSTQSIASGVTGSLELVYNQRISSIKTLMAIFGRATSSNKNYDSVDVTQNGGDYSFIVASQQYPQRAISTAIHGKASAFCELAGAWSANNSFSEGMSITPKEFAVVSTAAATSTTALVPGKFFLSTNVEKIHGSQLLTGISSMLSPISLRLNGLNTAEIHNAILLICYDALIEINPATRQVIVKQ
jgi:hypothetical protein